MPVSRYGVLKGRAIDSRLGAGSKPHYQVRMVAGREHFRVAINVRSQLAPSELEYAVLEQFSHPLTDRLRELPNGFSQVPTAPDGAALDYIRGNLVQPWQMVPLAHNVPGPDNDLNEKLDHYIQRALADELSVIYAFGEPWGPEDDAPDKYFGFLPGRGVHNVHMNQGNSARFVQDDGVWQDGGIVIHYPEQDQWVAILLKFQSQAWHTDDQTGRALALPVSGPPSDRPGSGPIRPSDLPTSDRPDGMLRIVAALVNDVRSPEREIVAILNASPSAVSLAGWTLKDKRNNRQPLEGTIEPGAIAQIRVRAPVQLSNQGGTISLLDNRGVKVHGVSYTREQARHPGWTITF